MALQRPPDQGTVKLCLAPVNRPHSAQNALHVLNGALRVRTWAAASRQSVGSDRREAEQPRRRGCLRASEVFSFLPAPDQGEQYQAGYAHVRVSAIYSNDP